MKKWSLAICALLSNHVREIIKNININVINVITNSIWSNFYIGNSGKKKPHDLVGSKKKTMEKDRNAVTASRGEENIRMGQPREA